MSQAIITRRVSGGGAGKVYTPQYTGTANTVYTNAEMTGGYIEITSSGTLTWVGDPPEEADLFCVGGGGASDIDGYSFGNQAGSSHTGGGGGGYQSISGGVYGQFIGGAGGSNGSNGGRGTVTRDPAGVGNGGAGQGTPTTDLIGRRHAGGGGGAGGGAAGASDFTAGKGGGTYGGGGYGGGGMGVPSTYYTGYGNNGGQGFAMIAWGTYKEDLGLV